MKRLVAHVSGKVQAVGYRSMVVTMARTLDIKGFVQNLPNGKHHYRGRTQRGPGEIVKSIWME